jgi:hypothetical protein
VRRPEPLRGAGRLRWELEQAQARIAELERLVQEQQVALAAYEAAERELSPRS